MRDITGLDDTEAAQIAAQFGVALEQIRRDHLISLILPALTAYCDELIFFGGTALARTHLPDGRLSEDIDLLTTIDRRIAADHVTKAVEQVSRATYGRVTWAPSLSAVREVEPAVLTTDGGVNVRIQLLNAHGYPPWPSEVCDLIPRYSDALTAQLRVPTLDAFVGWKTTAWLDRAAARDLYDLWALAGIGAITPAAAELFKTHGPTASPPRGWMFTKPPSDAEWTTQLAHQTRLDVSPATALAVVRDAWHTAID